MVAKRFFTRQRRYRTICDMPLFGFIFCRCLCHTLIVQLASVTLGPTSSIHELDVASSPLAVSQRTPPVRLTKVAAIRLAEGQFLSFMHALFISYIAQCDIWISHSIYKFHRRRCSYSSNACAAPWCIVQLRLSEHVGTRQNVRIIESSDNRGCLYINAFMRGPRWSVRIIECSDNRSSDNRGSTVRHHQDINIY